MIARDARASAGPRVVVVNAGVTHIDKDGAALRKVDATVLHVQALGSESLTTLACDAIVLFADDFDDATLAHQLADIERNGRGVVLVVVTKRPGRWASRVERGGAVVVHESSWSWDLLHAVLAARADDPESRPELPFTD